MAQQFLRSKVSKKKRRFVKDGFDLDLTCMISSPPLDCNSFLLLVPLFCSNLWSLSAANLLLVLHFSHSACMLRDLSRSIHSRMSHGHRFCIDITPRVIAMGFPAEAMEGIYRNPMADVQRYVLFMIMGNWVSAFRTFIG